MHSFLAKQGVSKNVYTFLQYNPLDNLESKTFFLNIQILHNIATKRYPKVVFKNVYTYIKYKYLWKFEYFLLTVCNEDNPRFII